MPQEFVDLAASNPEGLAEAMGSGMEAMTAAMEGGASPGEAFEAMGEAMGPMMEEMGISPEVFDSMGDMGTAMGDAGMGCHDVGAAMMGDPESETYMLPVDADGNAVVEAGQPETCPADAVQPPPADGACASTDGMIPPADGYDHATMQDGFVMPEPFDMATATNLSQGLNPDGPSSDGVPVLGDPDFVEAAPVDLGGALGVAPVLGEEGFVGADPAADAADAADAAMGSAMDSATDQGGGAIPVIGDEGFVEAAPVAVDDAPVDDGSSAGG